MLRRGLCHCVPQEQTEALSRVQEHLEELRAEAPSRERAAREAGNTAADAVTAAEGAAFVAAGAVKDLRRALRRYSDEVIDAAEAAVEVEQQQVRPGPYLCPYIRPLGPPPSQAKWDSRRPLSPLRPFCSAPCGRDDDRYLLVIHFKLAMVSEQHNAVGALIAPKPLTIDRRPPSLSPWGMAKVRLYTSNG